MLHAPATLSHTAYEVLWERAELGVMPPPISITYPLRCLANGGRLAATALAELHRDGLADGEQVDPDLVATLRALASAEQRYYALHVVDPSLAATASRGRSPQGKGPLIAVRGQAAVLAWIDADSLHLHPVRPDQAVARLIAELPANRPGNGPSLSFPASQLSPDGTVARQGAAEGSVLTQARPARTDADRYVALMSRPRAAMSYLYAVHDGRRCAHPIIAVDIQHEGRWLTRRQLGRGETEWIMAVPASADTLHRQLATLR